MVKKVIRFIVLIIGLSLVAYSGYHLFKIYSDYNTSDKTYEKLQDEYAVDDSKKNDDSTKGSEAQSPWYDDIDIDFAGLRSENPDVVGWIYFENEDISYPVMYSGDNSYYLRKTFKREHATAGSIFLEGSNKTDFSDCHTIIYGHNMNNETMFGTLDRYQDAAFWAANPTFTLTTPEEERRYEVFAAAVCRVLNTEEAGFRYYDHAGELTEAQQEVLTAWLAGQALYETGISPAFGEQIVILSTCSYHTDNGRFIVAARRIV